MEKGIPKRDGSGAGRRLNRGRGGCNPPMDKNARGFAGRGGGRGFGRRRIIAPDVTGEDLRARVAFLESQLAELKELLARSNETD